MNIVKQIENLDKIFSDIQENIKIKTPSNNSKNKVLVGYRNYCMSNLESILILVKNDKYSSAFILLRSLIEAFFRLSYTVICIESESDILDVKEGNYKFPKFHIMAEEMDKKGKDKGLKDFFSQFTNNGMKIYSSLSDATHCGEKSLLFHCSENRTFKTDEINEALFMCKQLLISINLFFLLGIRSKDVHVLLSKYDKELDSN